MGLVAKLCEVGRAREQGGVPMNTQHLPLDPNERVSVLLDSTDELYEGYPVVLQPYSELQGDIRLTEEQARRLHEILRARYEKKEAR
jgi:hypothetical protein